MRRSLVEDLEVGDDVPHLIENHQESFIDEDIIVYKFKIEGMTCVACSSSIERGLTHAFKDKGLVLNASHENSGVNVVLLMHQMRISLYKEAAERHNVDAKAIIDEVEDLGFGATLLEKFEIVGGSESSRSFREGQTPQIKIKESCFIVKGMTCASCTGAIENHFKNQVEGAISINISLLTNKAVIKHDTTKLRPRQIISEIEDLGFEAELQPSNESVDIREIVKIEVDKYKKRFLLALVLYLPISFLIWVVPYTSLKTFMT